MTETEFGNLYKDALQIQKQLLAAVDDARAELLDQASKNKLIVRSTVVREHLAGCQEHKECGWLEVSSEPHNVKSEQTWGTAHRQDLVDEAAEAIKAGQLTPWFPEPELDLTTLPFYRAR